MAGTFENFQPGADLWLVADPKSSTWTRTIDWYLNSQIMRAECRQAPEASPELLRIEEEWGCEHPAIATETLTHLMIASARLLPNRQTVVIPFTGSTGSWVEACVRVWQDMKLPTTRVFLPDGISIDDFQKAWPRDDSLGEIDLIAPLAVGASEPRGSH